MKISKKILSIVIAVVLAVSMIPFTASAADALEYDNNKKINVEDYNFTLVNGDNYIVTQLKGVSADGKIRIQKGQTSTVTATAGKYVDTTTGNVNFTNLTAPQWHFIGNGGTSVLATDKTWILGATDDSIKYTANGFGTKMNDNGSTYSTTKGNEALTTFTLDTTNIGVGTYSIRLYYKYQMKDNNCGNNSWKTRIEKEDDITLTLEVYCEHPSSKTINEKTANCTEDGYTGDKVCSICGAELEKGTTQAKTGHKFNDADYQYNNDAKFGVDGTETAPCANGCGATDTRTATGTALTHVHVESEEVIENYVEPTKTTDGSYDKVVYCIAEDECYVENRELSRTPVTISKFEDTNSADNSASLTLDDSVDFNFYIDTDYYLENQFAGMTESDLKYEVAYTNVSVEDPSQPQEDALMVVENVVTDANGRTLISVPTAPAQLTEMITITLKAKGTNNEGVEVVNEYSMKNYCDQVIFANLNSASVCKELIKYAAASQTYFNYNTENLAAVIDKAQLNADYNAVAAGVNGTVAVDDSISAFDVRGVSFLALSDTTVRFYLSVDGRPATNDDLYFGDYEIVNFEMQNQYGSREYDVHFAQTPEGLVYISVSGIESANLDNTFSFDVVGPTGTMEITYCATAFCKSAITNSSNDDLKTLAKTVVLYNVAADKVFVG